MRFLFLFLALFAHLAVAAGPVLYSAQAPLVLSGTQFQVSQTLPFQVMTLHEQATPSNPSATNYKLYFKSDGTLYSLNYLGVESPIGGGGGGGNPGGSSGSIQYNAAGSFGGFGTWDGTTATINAVAISSLTASTVPYLNGSKVLTSSSVTPTQLGYLSGASGTSGSGNLIFGTSPSISGATLSGSVTFSGLTATTVPYLDASKVLTSSSVTPTQLGYLSGASGTTGTGSLVFSASPTFTGVVQFASGTAANPSWGFSADSGLTGIYRITTNSLGFSANGISVGGYGSSGNWNFGPATGGVGTHIFRGAGIQLDSGVTATNAQINISNSATDSASNSILRIAVGGSSAGDPFIKLIDSIQTFAVGLDVSDSGKFKISAGNTLGSGDALTISTSGAVAFPNLTASTVPYLDSSKILTSSAVTPTQLGYLSGASGTTGTGNLVFSASPSFSGTVLFPSGSISSSAWDTSSSTLTAGATITASVSSGDSFVAAKTGDQPDIKLEGGASNDWYLAVGSSVFQILNNGGSSAISIAQSTRGVSLASLTASRAVVTDGSNVLSSSATTDTQIGYLSTLTSNVQTQLDAKAPAFAEYDAGNSSTSKTIDWTNGVAQKVTLTGSCTFAFTAPSKTGSPLVLRVLTGSGSYTGTWPATVKWAGGVAPVITTTASRMDLINFYYDGTNYYGTYSQNYTP